MRPAFSTRSKLVHLSIAGASPSASTSSSPRDASASVTPHAAIALGVYPTITALLSALADCQINLVTPLSFMGWQTLMLKHNLVHQESTQGCRLSHQTWTQYTHWCHS